MKVLSLQIILNEKSLIVKLFSLKIGYKQNQDTEVNWKIFTSKEGKRKLSECEIVLIFRAKHENGVEARRFVIYCTSLLLMLLADSASPEP